LRPLHFNVSWRLIATLTELFLISNIKIVKNTKSLIWKLSFETSLHQSHLKALCDTNEIFLNFQHKNCLKRGKIWLEKLMLPYTEHVETWDVTRYYGTILPLIETFKVQSWPGINFFHPIWGHIIFILRLELYQNIPEGYQRLCNLILIEMLTWN